MERRSEEMKERESSKDSVGSPEQLWEKWAAYPKRTLYESDKRF